MSWARWLHAGWLGEVGLKLRREAAQAECTAHRRSVIGGVKPRTCCRTYPVKPIKRIARHSIGAVSFFFFSFLVHCFSIQCSGNYADIGSENMRTEPFSDSQDSYFRIRTFCLFTPFVHVLTLGTGITMK
jgi:hypothetical protein